MLEPNDLNASHLFVFTPAMKTQRRHVQCIIWLIYMQLQNPQTKFEMTEKK